MKNKKIKQLKNIDLLPELPFYEELYAVKIDHAFKEYAMSYKVELVEEKKNPLIQLEASKSSTKDFFKDLIDKITGFEYQITGKETKWRNRICSCLFQFNNKNSDKL